MTLKPSQPPGRSNRKALLFAPEILRLRREGYSCDAIHRALIDVGLTVSLSTVKREAARESNPRITPERPNSAPLSPVRPPAAFAPSAPGSAFSTDPRSSKEIAADFINSRINGRFIRSSLAP